MSVDDTYTRGRRYKGYGSSVYCPGGDMLFDMKDKWKWDIFPANVTWIMDRYIDV